MKSPRYPIGTKIGRLLITGWVTKGGGEVFVSCDCGNERTVYAVEFSVGKRTTCGRGCPLGHPNLEHGHAAALTPTYRTWMGMLQRCNTPGHNSYPRYGGRGIGVCERWMTFANFLEDMGPRPKGKTIDRWPNKDGNYEPGNCRWATNAEQNSNRSDNVLLTHSGETHTVTEWATIKGCPHIRLFSRLRNGWSIKDALETPRLSKYESSARAVSGRQRERNAAKQSV